MRKSKFTEDQIAFALKHNELGTSAVGSTSEILVVLERTQLLFDPTSGIDRWQ